MSDPFPWPELVGLVEAEDFFEALQVPYQPASLGPVRLRVMKQFGMKLRSLTANGLPEDPDGRRVLARTALKEAHDLVQKNASQKNALDLLPPAQLVTLSLPQGKGP